MLWNGLMAAWSEKSQTDDTVSEDCVCFFEKLWFLIPFILRSLWVSSNKQRVGVNYLNRKAWKHSRDVVLGTPRKRLELFQVALNCPFDWQMAVWVRSLGRADLWPCWRVYPVIITMSSVKQRHGKASDPERQAINQYSSHATRRCLNL